VSLPLPGVCSISRFLCCLLPSDQQHNTETREREGSVHRPGELLPRTIAGRIRNSRPLPKSPLQRLKPFPDRPGMRPEVLNRSGHQPGQRGNQPTSLIQIPAWALVGVGIGQAKALGSGGHEHHRGPADYLDAGNVGQLAGVVSGRVCNGVVHGLVAFHVRPAPVPTGAASGAPLPPESPYRRPGPVISQISAARHACMSWIGVGSGPRASAMTAGLDALLGSHRRPQRRPGDEARDFVLGKEEATSAPSHVSTTASGCRRSDSSALTASRWGLSV
jgi:hypothetical protein